MLIWNISEQDERNLDRYEDFPRFCIKKELKVCVKLMSGEDLGKLTAMAYVITPMRIEKP